MVKTSLKLASCTLMLVCLAVRCFKVGGPYLAGDGNGAKKWIYLYFILSHGKGGIKVAAVTGLPLPQVLRIRFDQTVLLAS